MKIHGLLEQKNILGGRSCLVRFGKVVMQECDHVSARCKAKVQC